MILVLIGKNIVLEASTTKIEDTHRFQDDKCAISSDPRNTKKRMDSLLLWGESPVIQAAGVTTSRRDN